MAMTRCVAFLRGIGPADPNMRNERLREAATAVGLENVSTFISSGNVLFDCDQELAEIESLLEDAWPRLLGFQSTTFVRTRDDLQRLVDLRPFGALEHTAETYLLVSFFKTPLEIGFDIPHEPPRTRSKVVGATDLELFTVSDTREQVGLGIMAWLESQFGRQLTSRTWLTVLRVLKRLG